MASNVTNILSSLPALLSCTTTTTMRNRNWMALVFFALCSTTSFAEEELKGVVTKIIDGNTIEITTFNQEVYTLLLLGIDSPEPGQPFSENAKKLLSKLLFEKNVTVQVHGKNRLGNRLGVILMPDGVDPRHELLKAGLAWTSEKEPHPELEALRKEAHSQGVGLWSEPDPTPPWTYRRQQSMAQPKASW